MYQVGDRVWGLRQIDSKEANLKSRWEGPYEVVDRVGQDSYTVATGRGRKFDKHASQLKKYEVDDVTGQTLALYYYKKTAGQEIEAPDTWKIKKILDHRVHEGELQFLVHWEGGRAKEANWEPTKHFFQEYCGPCVDYAREKKLAKQLLASLPVGTEAEKVGVLQAFEKGYSEAEKEEALSYGLDLERIPGGGEYWASLA